MIGAVNGVSYKLYRGLSFGAALEEKTKAAGKAASSEPSSKLPDNFYTNISKNSTNNVIRRALFKSKGREEKDGKLTFASGIALGTGLILFGPSSFFAVLKAPKDIKLAFLKHALLPSNMLKNFPLTASALLMLAGIGINMYNNFDAKRTAKQRGIKNEKQPVTSPELQRLQKETKELAKKQSDELGRLYSAEYDANLAVYQKVLANAPMKYMSFKKPAV